MENQNQRFVKLKHRLQDNVFTIYFSASGEEKISGVIEHVAQTDPSKAEHLKKLLYQLFDKEEEFMDWIQASPENAIYFAENPLEAIKKIIPS